MSTPLAESGPRAATGPQYTLRRAGATAVVVSLAAGLRHYDRGGVELVESYGESVIAPGAAGITLAPFANRVDGGLWHLGGKAQQLDITEVARNNAIHGLLRNTGYAVLEQSEGHVLQEAAIHPQHGYPFLARHQVRHELTPSGALRVSQTLVNDSPGRAPFVLGAHPYFRLGDVPTEQLSITVDAATWLAANHRMIPTQALPVDDAHDLRRGRPVGELRMDTAFTDLAFTAVSPQISPHDGVARHTLSAPDGRSVSLWHDSSVAYVHVFITPDFPGRSLAVAMEPMTGPANAFNSGNGLRWLEPGESFTMRWGIDSEL
ncbi:aldose 1-epimerase [Arthrobacter silviterrae]|uniref:Aldose 1-epimerase family protein n=1 Tax=Arthrobacter silviterrae TaxID=2026658 RepID=A0ABX0DBU2_9MICC|nr:aldose 1-epimerase family protein [Arthrobacter silviterrae]MDQ0279175.1 aldose 1-epimerase [Arthrobacter silviterrae]NGN83295.1 aldose 1-epimerase family protein [Arthrobacter silviterrae]